MTTQNALNTQLVLPTGSTAINQLLYTSAANVVSGLASAANGVLITSAGSVPSISSTLPAAVQGNITSVGTISSGTWNGSVIGLAFGGTNSNLTASNGGIFYSTATAGAILAGTATANQIVMSGATAAPSWSTATYPATTTINQVLYSSANNVITGLATVNSASLVTSLTGVPTWLGPLTNGQIIIGSTGAIPVATSLTAGSGVTITPGAGSITISATGGSVNAGTINQLAYYAATGSTVSGLATGNNGILITSSTGVPSIATTFGQGLSVASSVLSVGGANNIPFNTTKGMQDNNGNSLLLFTVTASAVNYVNITNSATANSPVVSALGSDTNILLTLNGKGTSGVGTQGTTAGGNAVAGYVGELISSVIPLASAVSIGTATTVNLTSISLTAGDWDVAGNVNFIASGVTLAIALCWVSATSATLPDASLYNGYNSNLALNQTFASSTPFFRASLSTTTTIYISGRIVTAAGGTVTMCGGIYARRVR